MRHLDPGLTVFREDSRKTRVATGLQEESQPGEGSVMGDTENELSSVFRLGFLLRYYCSWVI
jgi:hypothetical protein